MKFGCHMQIMSGHHRMHSMHDENKEGFMAKKLKKALETYLKKSD